MRASEGPADRRVVAVNFGATEGHCNAGPGAWLIEVASDGQGEGRRFTGELAPHQAVLLRPSDE
jgi:hypothetical protein